MKSLNEKCSPLEDKKSATFLNIIDAIVELGGPPLVKDSTLIYFDELEAEVSKFKDKWGGGFESMTNFFEESIKEWTIHYVNLNNNILIIVNET